MTPSTLRADSHYRSVDGLRGVAILLVVFNHLLAFRSCTHGVLFAPALLLRSGWMGVDIFFVLSGLLISRPFLKAKIEGRSVGLKGYAVRRVFKIIPPCYLAIALAAASACLMGNGGDLFRRISQEAFFYYTIAPTENPLLAVLWTLGVEAWFYLLLPLAFFLCRRLTVAQTVSALLLGFWLFAPAVKILSLKFSLPSGSWLGTLSFFQYFAWGIAFAYLDLSVPSKTLKKHADLLFCIGVAGLSALIVGFGYAGLAVEVEKYESVIKAYTTSFWFPPAIGLSCFFLLFSSLGSGRPWHAFLNSWTMVGLGVVSYEWYLLHTIFSYAGHASSSVFRFLIYSVIPGFGSLGLAVLVYRYYSLPILNAAKRSLCPPVPFQFPPPPEI
ncbi:Peptidoglycan/LPS O-acetylase OafA/YrhL, contains acyltransferase and SGNH-hydrolase domains [Verrucomicrobium sp. GAS474]|uniref:acyltransferase family protein n=1 Tax=Verrucomicrobium sp. GAS474 TaxID=1882831 RepID=UPI00087D5946|nr:acyltransferase [Verrucomicrobium sp. GAS474]SDT90073.1 Peptidoglycan/LPS O-acetylase OafA/YrhL, contains acyltransferase and SGNH-hydrolase domains [Verrucomicrobium sp. GAS474]